MVSFKRNLPKYLIYIAIAPSAEIGGSTTKFDPLHQWCTSFCEGYKINQRTRNLHAHHVFTTQKCKISTLTLFRLYLNELNFI